MADRSPDGRIGLVGLVGQSNRVGRVGRPARDGRARRYGLIAAGVTVSLFAAATGRLFVWPSRDAPERADAIVMYAGTPGRLERAVSLARQGYAPVLVVSTPVPGEGCPPPIDGVETICFRPDPLTTQGEARETARLAAQRGWTKVIVVTAVTQTTRARLRLRRCYPGSVLMDPVTVPAWSWGYWIAYEWAATAKALIWQRSC